MERARYDVEFTRGDYYALRFTFVDASSNPLFWVGMTFTAQVRLTPDSRAVVPFDVDDSRVAFGEVLLSLEDTATETLAGSYVWDLQMVNTAAKPLTLIAGTVFVNRDVTREEGS